MSARQREASARVIESGTGPVGGVVALCAGLRKAGLYVIRICGGVEIRLMAADAGRVRAGQIVVTVDVALRALQRRVRTGQRESRRGVVEGRSSPCRSRVALLAGRREARLDVVRIGGAIEVLHMARGAIGRRSDELPIDMALRTRHAHVRAGQREFRESVVIESRRIPRAGVMARLASGREAGLRVRRVVGLIKVRHVAAVASRRRIVELPTRVAGGTIEGRVSASQGEAGELQVIKLGAHPVVHRVALFAGDGQT